MLDVDGERSSDLRLIVARESVTSIGLLELSSRQPDSFAFGIDVRGSIEALN